MTGMYGQRCGTAVKITMGSDTWQHGACHQHDADSLEYLTGDDKPFPSVGGWHDAGDYGKYVNNGAFSVGMLLAAWEHFQPTLAALALPIPEHGKTADGGAGPLPDFLWEVKWELDWLLSAQNASGGSGGLPDKLTALDFEPYGTMPDGDGQKRYFSGIGTAMTADVVAVMAKAARIYKDDAPTDAAKYLAAAQLGYAYLAANAGPAVADNDDPGYDLQRLLDRPLHRDRSRQPAVGGRRAVGDDRRSGGAGRLRDARGAARPSPPTSTGRTSPTSASTPICCRSGRTPAARDATLVSALSASLMTAADLLVTTAGSHAFGRAIGDNFYWGSNGSVARTAMLLWVANLLGPRSQVPEHHPDAGRLPAGAELLRSIAGDDGRLSPADRAPPRAVERRRDPRPLAGAARRRRQQHVEHGAAVGHQLDRQRGDYEVNEIAINWITPFVYATAALTPPAM